MTKLATVIDCFCGAGGLSFGFRRAGFTTLFAFDNDPACVATYRQNIDSACVVANAHDVSRQIIEETIGHPIGLDVLAGGPPCQGFSVQRRGSDEDERNTLVLEFIRLVEEFKPKFFLMENVGGLLSPRGLSVMDSLRARCQTIEYFLHIDKLSALDFGVPQDRRRVFVVGEQMKDGLARFHFPFPGSVSGPRTVRDAIGDLIGKGEADVPNHKADKLSTINLRRIQSLREGQGRDSLPEDLRLDCHQNNSTHRHLDVYGRMRWDSPAPTITARFDSFSRGRFGHPELDRSITLREGARLQTFPDDFIFSGTKVQVAKQVGNAVPPNLAYAVARQLYHFI